MRDDGEWWRCEVGDTKNWVVKYAKVVVAAMMKAVLSLIHSPQSARERESCRWIFEWW